MDMITYSQRQLELTRRTLQGMRGFHPVARARVRARLRFLEEGQRDILNTAVTDFNGTNGDTATKNNYTTYEKQVEKLYEMYEGRSDYGAELLGGTVDLRVSFIAGEGLSVVTKNEKAKTWVKIFLKDNKLNGSLLLDLVNTGELEGRNLLTLRKARKDTGLLKDKDQEFIQVGELKWQGKKYKVEEQEGRFTKATYKEGDQEKTLSPDTSVYVVLGRRLYNNQDATPGRLHKIVTEFENFSRAKYDLRTNTHLFARYMLNFKTQTLADAQAINALIRSKTWNIGDTYVGPADLNLVEPSGGAGEAIEKDILMALKIISSVTGVPMHWLAWPELMSNRATAENLMEVVNAATLRERLVWQEALRELILKAMILDGDPAIVDPDLTVRLSLVSLATLKAMIETYLQLVSEKIISRQTFTSLLPGTIDYEEEQDLIDEDSERAAERSPMLNGALTDALSNIPGRAPGQPGQSGQAPGQKPKQPVPPGGAKPKKEDQNGQ